MQLHGRGEVQSEIFQVRTAKRQFAKNLHGDELHGKVDVEKCRAATCAERGDERFDVSNVHGADVTIRAFRPQEQPPPQLLMTRDEQMPAMTNASATDKVERCEIGEDREKD